MITFLSSPKAFAGAALAAQRNAIRSWQAVQRDVEVILYGDAPGSREAAAALGTKHVGQIACSASGVPQFGAIAEHARQHATFDVQVYLNCDILLTGRILEAVSAVGLPRYVMVGQRIDLWPDAKVTPESPHWAMDAERLARDARATLHPPSGMDYFAFTRGLWDGLRPLTIGRSGYDNALIAFCLRRDIPVVDGTYMIPALHQHHDYSHLAGRERELTSGPDAEDNKRLHGVAHSPPDIVDATWQLREGRLLRNRARGDWLRSWEAALRFRWGLLVPGHALRALWRFLVAVRAHRPARLTIEDVLDFQFPKR